MNLLRRKLFRMWYALGQRQVVFRHLAELQSSHFQNRETLSHGVRSRLAHLVRHAVRNVPYYADLAKHLKLSLSESSVEAELAQFPLLTKGVLRAQFAALRGNSVGPYPYTNTSGGSTGEPAIFLQDRAYENWSFANKILFYSWLGYQIGEPVTEVWGAPQDIFGGGSQLKKRLRNIAVNEEMLNCYRVEADTWSRYADRINQSKPAVILAYADAMVDFSRYLFSEHRAVHVPKGIVTTAGVLDACSKELIESAFRCPVVNRYGSREVGDLACSCTRGSGLHVSEWTHYIEILDDAGRPCAPGEEGDVVVTLLTNYSMPLIRYRIEDRAIWSERPCKCGRTTRTLKAVVGRRSDYLLAVNGAKVNGTALTTLLYDVPGIQRYQYRQTAPAAITISLVPLPHVKPEDLKRRMAPALQKASILLGPEMKIDVEVLPQIEVTRTGKHRYIVNQLVRSQGHS